MRSPIDLVHFTPGSIGEVLDAIHEALDPWLGRPKWQQTEGRVLMAGPGTSTTRSSEYGPGSSRD